MPDQSDVEAAMAAAAAGALYPDGPGGEPAAGVLCRVFRGYPASAALNADLTAGRVSVSVTPVEGSYRNTTRFLTDPAALPALPTLKASISGDTVTWGGTADAGQLAGVLVDGGSYVYRTTAGDTPGVVAAALAALVRVDRPALLSGASVAFPGAARLAARAVADTANTTELRRQTQEFRVSAWAPSAALRDATCGLLDVAFAGLPFLDIGGAGCRLRSGGSSTSDQSQSAGLYRRDLLFTVEYPTTVTVERPVMLFGVLAQGGTRKLV